jgi:type I restriction enzyme S subunit
MNTPKIRFKGFKDDWEQRKLGNYIIEYQKVTNQNNQYPVLTSSRKGIFLQTDYYSGNQVASDDNTGYNIVPYGYFTYRHMSDDEIFHFNINDIVENGIVSTLYPVFTTTDYLDSRYLQYQLNYGQEFAKFAVLQKQGGSRTYMYLNKLKTLHLTMPKTIDEQKQISGYFMKLDHLITLHQRRCDETKQLKKFMLQKMFPKNGEKNPEIRFEGFTDDWEQRKFGDIVQTRRGLTYKPTDIEESGIRVLRSSNIDEDTFVYGDDDVFVNPNAVNIEPVRKNDILITSANGSSRLVGKHTLIKEILDNSAVHGGFMLLGRTKNYDFVNASMSSSWYTRFISVFVAGGNGTIGNLNKNDLDEQIILVPDGDDEQIKIGEYFANLDHLITLHQRKCEKLKELKQYMLQNMFV